MVECNNPATVPVPAHPLPPMPHDPEAEWSIIGMFLYLEVNSSNISRFDPDNDFYDFKAAAVMNIIRDLDESGQQPSYSNVYSCLLKKFEHEAQIGQIRQDEVQLKLASYMSSISNSVSIDSRSRSSFGNLYSALKDLSNKRTMLKLAFDLEACTETSSMLALIRKAMENVESSNSLDIDEDCIIDVSKEFPEPPFLLERDHVGLIPIGDIQAVKAKAKQGKTHLCVILAAAILGSGILGFRCRYPDASVLWFDTEQAVYNTAKIARSVHKLCGWDEHTPNPRFTIYHLREKSTQQILNTIISETRKRKPTAIIIDGIRDLVSDFNNLSESDMCVKRVMNLSSSLPCAAINVIHENKGKDDSNMRGHLGSELVTKSSEVFAVKKDGGIFMVSQTECRNEPIPEFSFTLEADGTPIDASSHLMEQKAQIKQIKYQHRLSEMAIAMKKILVPYKKHNEFVKELKSSMSISESTAKSKIKEALFAGIICKNEQDGLYWFARMPDDHSSDSSQGQQVKIGQNQGLLDLPV